MLSTDAPVLLAIDCSDRACSLALGNGQSLIEEYTDEPRQHAKKLLPMYRELLARSSYDAGDISAIAVAAGPGSFTGLRIGFSFAQGLAFALSVPLVQVSSLEAMAVSSLDLIKDKSENPNQVQVCLDARMGELYVAGFNYTQVSNVAPNGLDRSALERQYDDALIGIDSFDLSTDYASSALIGSGFALEQMAVLNASIIMPDVCIHASAVHSLGIQLLAEGKTSDAIGSEPVYLRRENAWKTVEQQKQAAASKASQKQSS